jgi:hypothetical protein
LTARTIQSSHGGCMGARRSGEGFLGAPSRRPLTGTEHPARASANGWTAALTSRILQSHGGNRGPRRISTQD